MQGSTLRDDELRVLQGDCRDCQLFVWTQEGNVVLTLPISSIDLTKAELVFDASKTQMKVQKGDHYRLIRSPDFLSEETEYALETRGKSWFLRVLAKERSMLADVEVSQRRAGIVLRSHTKLEGVHVEQCIENGIQNRKSGRRHDP